MYYPPQQTISTVYVYPHSTISTVYVYPPQPSTITVTDYVVETDTSSTTPPRITFYPPRDAAPEPEAEAQVFGLGPVSRTVQGAPTSPLPWWNWWATATPSVEIIDRDTNEKREPQGLGPVSRTVQGAPTPPFPWWNWRATATPSFEIVDRDTNEKREPQSLGFGASRSKHI